jgi:hypothetical protein
MGGEEGSLPVLGVNVKLSLEPSGQSHYKADLSGSSTALSLLTEYRGSVLK